MLAAIPLLAVAVVDGAAVLGRHSAGTHKAAGHPPPRQHHTAAAADRRASAAARAERAAAIRDVLARLTHAVRTHDRAEWQSTLDPERPGFVEHQLQVFDNLRHVPFASWDY